MILWLCVLLIGAIHSKLSIFDLLGFDLIRVVSHEFKRMEIKSNMSSVRSRCNKSVVLQSNGIEFTGRDLNCQFN